MTIDLAPTLTALDQELRFTVDQPVQLDRGSSFARWTLVAQRELAKTEGAHFAAPPRGVDIAASAFGPGACFLGFSFIQFAWPALATTTTPFDFHPEGEMISPPVVVPLAVQTDETAILFAPLDHWHEQVIAVDQTDAGPQSFRWSWHGDLDPVDAGFAISLGVFSGPSIGALFDAWGAMIRSDAPRHRDDPLMTHLSYWTDNGAAYWYRREPGLDLATTLENKIAELDHLGVPIGSVELDSWFYRHETSRPVTELGELADVPPTGMLEWQPRADVLPDGVEALRARLGDKPLALHSRHIAASSPYLDDGDWWTQLFAHPVDQRWFAKWFDDAASWGATCIEQDWIIMFWFGVEQLRSTAGRALEWLEAMNDLAAERNMAVVLCMALPGDFMAAASLDRVIAMRTNNDYRYTTDRAILWRWYLAVNRLAAALTIPTFKDCFFTHTDPGESGLDGDPHAHAESVLAALSGGIVGIGDRIGRTDVAIVERLLDAEGRIATSDGPIAFTDASLFEPGLGVSFADAWSGEVRYVLALHLADTDATISGSLDLGEEVLVYDWRSGSAVPATDIDVSLSYRDWALYVCAPIVDVGGTPTAVLGDPTRYAMASPGPRRTTLTWRDGNLTTE